MVAGFAVSLGVALAIGFSGDFTTIIILGSSDEPHSDAEMMTALDIIWGLRRPVELLVPTVLGILAIVKAVQSRRTEGPSTSSVMAMTLAVSGPFITIGAFVVFFMFGAYPALMAGDM